MFGFSDFLVSLLVNSGYVESGARKKVERYEEGCEVSSSYKNVHFGVEFYNSGSLGVRVSFEGEEELVKKVEEEMVNVKSNSELRREKGHISGRKVRYDEGVVIDVRIKREGDGLYEDIWGYLIKPGIKASLNNK